MQDKQRRNTERRKKKTAKKNISKAQELKKAAEKFFNKNHKHNLTRRNYIDHYNMFIDYCRKSFRCTTKEECGEHIQDYSDWLQSKGKSASTIHTYLAPVCGYHGVSMKEIRKPSRKVSETKRSRTREDKYKRSDQQYNNDKYKFLADFQACVGLRRAELKILRLNSFKQDESGKWCIEVIGKGNKYQLQRVLPDDLEFIKKYFNTPNSAELLFKDSDFSDNMDYHHLRAIQSQKAYQYYYNSIYKEDGTIDSQAVYKLRGELMARWNKYNLYTKRDEIKAKEKIMYLKTLPDTHKIREKIKELEKIKDGKPRAFPFDDTKGFYKLRGDNRRFALEHGLPLEYDKLCVMAVSIFHLSHWRLDTLTNYLLAV